MGTVVDMSKGIEKRPDCQKASLALTTRHVLHTAVRCSVLNDTLNQPCGSQGLQGHTLLAGLNETFVDVETVVLVQGRS
jgi:hypothetical protein